MAAGQRPGPNPSVPPRTPWRRGFPEVISHASEGEMRGHFAYRDAKDGKDERSLPAAVVLVLDLISDSGVTRVREIVGERRIKIVGVHAQEARGRNKIPVAYAEILAHVLDQNAVPEIIQSSIANHS